MAHPHQPRRQSVRRDRANDNQTPVNDGNRSRWSPHQVILLMESTSASTRYVDVYKDALERSPEGRGSGTVLVDHDRIVGSLADSSPPAAAVDDETYRSLHRQARAQLVHNHGRVTAKLMVQLVRQAIVVAVRRAGGSAQRREVVLTGFFDPAFVTGFAGVAGFKTAAIVELSCGKIRQTREKFESRAAAVRRAEADAVVRRFWTGFRETLDTVDGAAAFQDVVVYRHECRYDAGREPPNHERIIAATAEFVLRDVARVQRFVSDVRAGCGEYNAVRGPRACPLADVNDADGALRYGRAYDDRLARFREAAVTVALVVDAIVSVVLSDDRPRADDEWVDDYFDELIDDRHRGCSDRPACVQYGDECGLTAKRFKLHRTDYARSIVSVTRTRWKRSLWGRRSLLSPSVEAGYDDEVSAIKRRLACADDVDERLCVLGLNRLQNNLDVFRGETVDLSGLGAVDVTFRPTVIEPVGCATMVQMLDKQAEAYRKTSHAYFAPEDVVLVGFYDFQPVATTHKSSFDGVVPQWPVGVADYFDYFHGKRTPECLYVMGSVDVASPYPTTTYREDTDETCFQNGDCLTVTRRKWRWEPGTVCLAFKSERYEIVRHVVDDDRDGGDRFRIYTGSGGEIGLDKSREGLIGFTGRLSDGGTVDVFDDNGHAICTMRLPHVRGTGGQDRVETSRQCGDGCVTIEYADQSKITCAADGGVVKNYAPGSKIVRRRSKSGKVRAAKSQLESRKSRVTKTPIESRKSRVTKTRSNKNAAAVRTTTSKESVSEAGTDSENARDSDGDQTKGVVEYSRDGSRRTVTFEDGTTITTVWPRLGKSPAADRSSLDVVSYEYKHPAYKTVTDDRDTGTFRVAGVVTRSEDGALRLPRWPGDPGGVDVTTTAVVVRDADGLTVATFGWTTAAGDGVEERLFEKRDGRRYVSVVARRDPGKPHRTVTYDDQSCPVGSATPRPAAYFIVKRGMSGFAVPDPGRYDRFVEEILGRRGTAIHEDGREIVALFVDGDVDETERALTTTSASAPGFAWLNPSFVGGTTAAGVVGVESLLADLRTSGGRLQLTSRTFRTIDVDYGPVLDALRRRDVGPPRSTPRPPHVRLRARAYVPDLDGVKAVYLAAAARDKDHAGGGVDSAAVRSEERERRRVRSRTAAGHARQALLWLASNTYIPYFHRDSYQPLGDGLRP